MYFETHLKTYLSVSTIIKVKKKGLIMKKQSLNSSQTKKTTTTLMQWVGGKVRLADKLVETLPETYNNYFEPFIGAGSLFFKEVPENGYISDMNYELINCYKIIQSNVEELIVDLGKHEFNLDYYMRIRSLDRDLEVFNKLTDIERGSRFLYLMKGGYNGLWRVNQKNQNNVAWNKKTDLEFDYDYIREASKKLQNTVIEHKDFMCIKDNIQKGDFCYFDSPYDNSTNEKSYTKEGFGVKEQEQLKELCDYIDSIGAYFLLSNSCTERTLNLYSKYRIEYISMKQNISSNKDKRVNTTEILVSNYTNQRAVNNQINNVEVAI
ncbi:DNA adenine methylase [Candidatus Sulfurimonas baltica]|uniref:site-specific DNA-methyltransferase (adenine-specific) n=1 Tax=Candidatus Sulfurimonas baltica TaxID=2740404 RepID=A0A7S7LWM7_9BACT|nr:Dam family site-specific DNA-(adenine-N6)-methyltransferase [Candidatus Sulfurimonas baltica]QOY52735.1 Dam family site-specific DNA-(adenine-N6)-methyltransferase [Candidatus Sulfurimonas baltica]